MVAIVYYGGLCVLMALILTKTLPHLLPATVSRHVADDSEGYVLALLLPLWIDYARPRLAGRRMAWAATAAAAVASFAVFVLLYRSHSIVGSVKTLNETFFAVAVLILYVQPARRPSRLGAAGCTVGVLGVVILTEHTPLATVTTHLAEGAVMLMLAPLAFDLMDRGILAPDRPSLLRLRQIWWVLLVVLPLAFIGLRHAHLGAPLAAADQYATRAQEAFIGMLLIALYFAVRGARRLAASMSTSAAQRASTTETP